MIRGRLLVVDDEVDLLAILVRIARERGYEATGTADPSEVIDRVRALLPDVVLLDLHLPRSAGRELLARIVAEPGAPAVIVMSGWIDEITYEICRRSGATAIIRKPFDPDDLFRRVDAVARIVASR